MHGALHTTPSLFSLQYHLHLADGEIEVQRDSGIWPRSHSQEVAEWGFDPRSAIPGAVSTSSLLWCLSPCSFSGISSSSISLSWGQRMTKLTLDQMSPFRTEPPGAEFTDNHPGRRIDPRGTLAWHTRASTIWLQPTFSASSLLFCPVTPAVLMQSNHYHLTTALIISMTWQIFFHL